MKKLIDEVRKQQSVVARGRNLYLCDDIYLNFKAICEHEEVPVSSVVEHLMIDFMKKYSQPEEQVNV